MSIRWLMIVLLFTMSLAGCGDPEPIVTTKVPKSPADAAPVVSTEYRILGAVFPADDPVWFFKLSGPAEKLADQVTKFDEFLKTIRFPNGLRNGPLWDLPAEWRDGPAKQMRFATILVGPGEKPHEMSISQVGGGLKPNLDRWADQLGMPGGAADLTATTKELTTSTGAKGLRVDLRGPKDPTGGMPPFAGGR